MKIEPIAPYPCEVCGGTAAWTVVITAFTFNGAALMSSWFCDEHEAHCQLLAGEVEEHGDIACVCPADEAVEELASCRAVLLSEGLISEVDGGEVLQDSTCAGNRAQRRAAKTGRHRQRRRG